MAITLDHEEFAISPWTIVAELDDKIVASLCSSCLQEAQFKMDLLLVELGYDIYTESQLSDGFIIY